MRGMNAPSPKGSTISATPMPRRHTKAHVSPLLRRFPGSEVPFGSAGSRDNVGSRGQGTSNISENPGNKISTAQSLGRTDCTLAGKREECATYRRLRRKKELVGTLSGNTLAFRGPESIIGLPRRSVPRRKLRVLLSQTT